MMSLPIDLNVDGYYVIEPYGRPVFTPAGEPVRLPALQEAVGGYIELFQIAEGGASHVPGGLFGSVLEYVGTTADMFLHEEGKLEGRELNPMATEMARASGLPLGDFTGIKFLNLAA